ncbi:MAG: helix-turn-helix domain-containing protein [Rhodospirillaceae bacterium]|nr:helix-turn-helix domain-containing protein [Rhodospirillaceae bacterium]
MPISIPGELREQLCRLTAVELLAILAGQAVQPRKDPNTLLPRKQAAAYLSISHSYLRKLEASGKGPKLVRISERVLRYRISELDTWLANGGPNGRNEDKKKR